MARGAGGITLENVGEVAATGVDSISLGWLTHSSKQLDLGMDLTAPAVRSRD